MTHPDAGAFPKPPAYYPANDPDFAPEVIGGLTKREWFAGMAMQGMVAGITRFREDIEGIIINRPKDISELSCLYADTLIAELNKETK